MAVTSSASDLRSPVTRPQEKKSRSKCPGVRVIGGRIYDSDKGMTCHQCRQKTLDFAARCKHQKKDKPCPIKYCHKCLINRYGEKAEEVVLLDAWECPRCRGICNCSFCMKKRGHQPTGLLARTAKENGFSCVSELLHVKGPNNFFYKRITKDVVPAPPMESNIDLPVKPGKENFLDVKNDASSHSPSLTKTAIEKESTKKRRKELHELDNSNSLGTSSQKRPKLTEEIVKNEMKIKEKLKKKRKNGVIVENVQSITESQNAPSEELMVIGTINNEEAGKYRNEGVPDVDKNNNVETKKKKPLKSCDINNHFIVPSRKIDDDIPLPIATSLITVSGVELPNELAGDALQFFEFCTAFGQALDFKNRQAEAVIREIVLGRRGRRLQGSLLVQFHIKLLSLILEDIGERSPTLSVENGKNSWLKALEKCVTNCNFIPVEFSSDIFDGNEIYVALNALQKFKLLNFLCDEALSTNVLRSWIDGQNLKFVESMKEAKEKLLAAKDKKKLLRQKVQDEVAKAFIAENGATLSLSEHQELISQIKKEAALAQAEILEAMGMMAPKNGERSDAVRTDLLFLDDNGRVFWRLKGYKDKPDILLQDMGTWDSVSVEEKWFVYAAEQKERIEKYISSLRMKRLRAQKVAAIPYVGHNETNL